MGLYESILAHPRRVQPSGSAGGIARLTISSPPTQVASPLQPSILEIARCPSAPVAAHNRSVPTCNRPITAPSLHSYVHTCISICLKGDPRSSPFAHITLATHDQRSPSDPCPARGKGPHLPCEPAAGSEGHSPGGDVTFRCERCAELRYPPEPGHISV